MITQPINIDDVIREAKDTELNPNQVLSMTQDGTVVITTGGQATDSLCLCDCGSYPDGLNATWAEIREHIADYLDLKGIPWTSDNENRVDI